MHKIIFLPRHQALEFKVGVKGLDYAEAVRLRGYALRRLARNIELTRGMYGDEDQPLNIYLGPVHNEALSDWAGKRLHWSERDVIRGLIETYLAASVD